MRLSPKAARDFHQPLGVRTVIGADHQKQVDEGAFELGLDSMIQGLVEVYERAGYSTTRPTRPLPSGARLR